MKYNNKIVKKIGLIFFYSLVLMFGVLLNYLYRVDKSNLYLLINSILNNSESSYQDNDSSKNSKYYDDYMTVNNNIETISNLVNITNINKSSLNSANYKVVPITQSNSFRVDSAIKATLLLKKDISDIVSSANNVQGMCTDGKYLYIAFMSKTNYKLSGSKKYTDQSTTLVKLNLNGKVINKIKLGKIGHSNGLAYNPVTNKIIFAPCNKSKNYIYQISANFNKNTKKEKIILKNGNNNFLTDSQGKVVKTVASISYNEKRNEILVKINNNSLAVFDPFFNFKRMITTNKSLKNNSNLTGQAIYTEGDYIYSVFNNLRSAPYKNYINVYNYETGEFIKTISLGRKISDIRTRIELESIVRIGNKYYTIGNYNGDVVIIRLALLS